MGRRSVREFSYHVIPNEVRNLLRAVRTSGDSLHSVAAATSVRNDILELTHYRFPLPETFPSRTVFITSLFMQADVAKLVDARDLKSLVP